MNICAVGISEKVYENALVHRLGKQGIQLDQQIPIDIYDEDRTPLGHYVADLLVEDQLIVGLKACHSLTAEHLALRGSKLKHGLLINFSAQRLQIRKLIL